MAEDLLRKALELFGVGDLAGATRIWLQLQSSDPDQPQVAAYLRHVQTVDPELLGALEAELGAVELPPKPGPVAPPVLAGAPIPTPMVVKEDDPWLRSEDSQPVHVASEGAGLSLVQSTASEPAAKPQSSMTALEAKLKERLELDDFTGALACAREILGVQPQHVWAESVQARCIERLQRMYQSKLGNPSAVPRVLLSPEELIWLDLDHRSGFVLAQVDGVSSYDEIVELTGMDPLESYQILAQLLRDGVIGAGGH